MPYSRRADGEPETTADKKFFDLRDAGYAGPIDQDGNRVTDPYALDIFKSLDEITGRAMASGQR